MEFEWDPRKDAANRRKHVVTFDEALTVFADRLARIFDDPDHSPGTRRENSLSGIRRGDGSCLFASPNGAIECGSSAHALQPSASGRIMRKTQRNRKQPAEMRREYGFDYPQARPNRFASRMQHNFVAVVLEPDVAQVFDSSEALNRFLRSVISALPKRRKRAAARKPRRKAS